MSQIPVQITSRSQDYHGVQLGPNKRNLITIRRNNKILEATNLPTIVSLNPRSLYNKQSNFKTLVEQTDTSVCLVSETWDRSHSKSGKLISDVIDIDGYRWVKNICQRKRRGGKPAILINEREYHITELCPDLITVPVGVEAVWALITPKCKQANTKIKHIAIGSIYYSSTQTKKNAFLDHIAEAFHLLCSKYGSDVPVIFGGDFNRLNIKPILNLSANLKQTVEVVTRRNPDATLDLIITNMASYYHSPAALEPLENDDDQTGEPSDHCILVMKPISASDKVVKRSNYKIIKYRPFPDSGIRQMGQWLQSQSWHEIYRLSCANEKAEKFEKMIMDKVADFFPEKSIKISSNDKPWVDLQLLKLDRKRKREYYKNKRSEKWKELNLQFQERAKLLKQNYYEDRVEDLKISNPSQ